MATATRLSEPAHTPPLGIALWLLTGGTLADRVQWAVAYGFNAVSLLQEVVGFEEKERADAARAIQQAGLRVTYHANVHQRLTAAGELDYSYVGQVIDDTLWWHHHTCGVSSFCLDPVYLAEEGKPRFSWDTSRHLMQMLAARLQADGIRFGIENSFGDEHCFGSLGDIARLKALCDLPAMGLLLDAGHANIHVRSGGVEGETEIGDFVRRLALEILEVHLSDNQGQHDEHKPIGYGNLDVRSLLRALKDIGFRGQLTVEVCLDLGGGRYAADISNPPETASILSSRDAVRSAWDRLAE